MSLREFIALVREEKKAKKERERLEEEREKLGETLKAVFVKFSDAKIKKLNNQKLFKKAPLKVTFRGREVVWLIRGKNKLILRIKWVPGPLLATIRFEGEETKIGNEIVADVIKHLKSVYEELTRRTLEVINLGTVEAVEQRKEEREEEQEEEETQGEGRYRDPYEDRWRRSWRG